MLSLCFGSRMFVFVFVFVLLFVFVFVFVCRNRRASQEHYINYGIG